MREICFSVEGDVVVKHTPIPQVGENFYKVEIVMDKEVFRECYKKWIEPQESEKQE